jgi:hypothetical protein
VAHVNHAAYRQGWQKLFTSDDISLYRGSAAVTTAIDPLLDNANAVAAV